MLGSIGKGKRLEALRVLWAVFSFPKSKPVLECDVRKGNGKVCWKCSRCEPGHSHCSDDVSDGYNYVLGTFWVSLNTNRSLLYPQSFAWFKFLLQYSRIHFLKIMNFEIRNFQKWFHLSPNEFQKSFRGLLRWLSGAVLPGVLSSIPITHVATHNITGSNTLDGHADKAPIHIK